MLVYQDNPLSISINLFSSQLYNLRFLSKYKNLCLILMRFYATKCACLFFLFKSTLYLDRYRGTDIETIDNFIAPKIVSHFMCTNIIMVDCTYTKEILH